MEDKKKCNAKGFSSRSVIPLIARISIPMKQRRHFCLMENRMCGSPFQRHTSLPLKYPTQVWMRLFVVIRAWRSPTHTQAHWSTEHRISYHCHQFFFSLHILGFLFPPTTSRSLTHTSFAGQTTSRHSPSSIHQDSLLKTFTLCGCVLCAKKENTKYLASAYFIDGDVEWLSVLICVCVCVVWFFIMMGTKKLCWRHHFIHSLPTDNPTSVRAISTVPRTRSDVCCGFKWRCIIIYRNVYDEHKQEKKPY